MDPLRAPNYGWGSGMMLVFHLDAKQEKDASEFMRQNGDVKAVPVDNT